MTREQAINYLISSGFSEEQVSEVVRALTYEPTTKNSISNRSIIYGNDCISRQAVIDMTGLSEWFDSSDSYNEFVIALSYLPSVTPQEPKTGKWISTETKGVRYAFWCRYKCSLCGGLSDRTNFCPNCGAKMV